ANASLRAPRPCIHVRALRKVARKTFPRAGASDSPPADSEPTWAMRPRKTIPRAAATHRRIPMLPVAAAATRVLLELDSRYG
ncbi:hypothetical protein B0H10DRAFT_2093322, partial [Mycena sp. CBHHK59/15]